MILRQTILVFEHSTARDFLGLSSLVLWYHRHICHRLPFMSEIRVPPVPIGRKGIGEGKNMVVVITVPMICVPEV